MKLTDTERYLRAVLAASAFCQDFERKRRVAGAPGLCAPG
jgi:hypothetical protein